MLAALVCDLVCLLPLVCLTMAFVGHDGRLQCPLCPGQPSTMCDMRGHYRRSHPDDHLPWVPAHDTTPALGPSDRRCRYCLVEFYSLDSREEHERAQRAPECVEGSPNVPLTLVQRDRTESETVAEGAKAPAHVAAVHNSACLLTTRLRRDRVDALSDAITLQIDAHYHRSSGGGHNRPGVLRRQQQRVLYLPQAVQQGR